MGILQSLINGIMPNSMKAALDIATLLLGVTKYSSEKAINSVDPNEWKLVQAKAELEIEYMCFYVFFACILTDNIANATRAKLPHKIVQASAVKLYEDMHKPKEIYSYEIEPMIENRCISYRKCGSIKSALDLFRKEVLSKYIRSSSETLLVRGNLSIMIESLGDAIVELVENNKIYISQADVWLKYDMYTEELISKSSSRYNYTAENIAIAKSSNNDSNKLKSTNYDKIINSGSVSSNNNKSSSQIKKSISIENCTRCKSEMEVEYINGIPPSMHKCKVCGYLHL